MVFHAIFGRLNDFYHPSRHASILESGCSLPLDPLIALGMFITENKPDIEDMAFGSDETIKMLYSMAHDFAHSLGYVQEESQAAITVEEWNKMLLLLDSGATKGELKDAAKKHRDRAIALQERYVISSIPSTSIFSCSTPFTSIPSSSSISVEDNVNEYKRAMEFVKPPTAKEEVIVNREDSLFMRIF